MERDLSFMWKELSAIRGQMQKEDLGGSGRRAGVAWAAPAHETGADGLERKAHFDAQAGEEALAKQPLHEEKKLQHAAAQSCEAALAKLQESCLAELRTQLKQYCDELFKEENDLRNEVSRVIQTQVDAVKDHLNEYLAKKSQPDMATVHEQAGQELFSQLEEALEREMTAREEADAQLLTTVRELLMEQEQRLLDGQSRSPGKAATRRGRTGGAG